MPQLTTVQVNSEFKLKTLVQNWVYGEDLKSLTSKTKNRETMWFPEYLEDTPSKAVNCKTQSFQEFFYNHFYFYKGGLHLYLFKLAFSNQF